MKSGRAAHLRPGSNNCFELTTVIRGLTRYASSSQMMMKVTYTLTHSHTHTLTHSLSPAGYITISFNSSVSVLLGPSPLGQSVGVSTPSIGTDQFQVAFKED